MKKILFFLLLISGVINAQQFKLEEKSVTGIFELKDKTKSEIFSLINKWIAINYNSSKNVIQMSDLESGTIIVKGINSINYRNSNYVVYNTTNQFLKMDVKHLLEISVKDNKYRIVYTLVDVDKPVVDPIAIPELLGFYKSNLDTSYVNFVEVNDDLVLKYNNYIEDLFKKAWVGKEKRERVMSLSRAMLQEVNDNLVDAAKKQMISIENTMSTVSKSDW